MGKKICSFSCSKGLMIGSWLSIGLAAIGWLGNDVWLASTQWLLISICLGLYSLWFKLEK